MIYVMRKRKGRRQIKSGLELGHISKHGSGIQDRLFQLYES
jgi:hypothetical protein